MIHKSARLQYVLLALVALCGLIHVFVGGASSFYYLAHAGDQVRNPFYNGTSAKPIRLTPEQARTAGVPQGFVLLTLTYVEPKAHAAGLHAGDAIYTVDGQPYRGMILMRELARRRIGQTARLTIWRAGTSLDSPPVPLTIPLVAQNTGNAPVSAWIVWGFFFNFLPAFCLVTGLYVVLARPSNPHAWLVLGVLAYASGLLVDPDWRFGFFLPVSLIWRILGQSAMSVCFMFLGIYFAGRAPLDRLFPWIKWALLAPVILLLPTDFMTDFGLNFHFGLVAPILPWLPRIQAAENIAAGLEVGFGFLCLYSNLHSPATAPDSRRRLRILIAGCTVGLAPLFALLALSLIHGTDLGSGVPQWLTVTIFAILFVFPLTLAYVVVVQRAMDLRILIRQGTKYFFARTSVFIVGVLIATWMSVRLSLFFSTHDHRRVVDVVQIFGLIGMFIAYRGIGSKRLQARIDQRFFREAYSTEQLLAELSDEARNFTETAPLLETVTQRLAATLHIDRIAVFLRAGDTFQLQYATGLPLAPGFIPALPAASTTIAHLARPRATPANVFRDDPASWLVDASDAERTALADLSTELLVPLPGRNRLVGVIALGPKSSEEPYSKTDRQLLQSVASQTGLALENAELLENLTTQLAQRARIDREIEIAREVQERLFPQSYPVVPGIDLAGFCRPAQFVGGDYYDFFLIPQPNGTANLAIAIGDISGKGISAALLMASLRASLRAVATIQPPQGATANLATVIGHVNRLVFEASTSNRYATFFYAELDPATRLLTYVNAGHNCPAVLRPGQPALQLQPTGTVVGLLEHAVYEQATIQLHSGDTLLAFTDGISEAMTADDEEWGEDRMIVAAQTLLAQPDCTHTAQHLLQCLLAQADAFTAGAPQHDDMTLLLATIA